MIPHIEKLVAVLFWHEIRFPERTLTRKNPTIRNSGYAYDSNQIHTCVTQCLTLDRSKNIISVVPFLHDPIENNVKSVKS